MILRGVLRRIVHGEWSRWSSKCPTPGEVAVDEGELSVLNPLSIALASSLLSGAVPR